MADKTIKVKVDVEADVQPTIAELKRLKLQLKETSDPTEFKRLQQQINDTEDAIKSARTGADNFAEVLGTLPGPIGSIGSAVGGTLQNLKQFGALKFSDIKASFTELGKDVIDAAKGLLQLTGITKAYEVVTAATSKALQFFGVSLNTANTAGKALGITLSTLLAATGILAIVAAVDILTNAWDNFSKKAERAEEAQKKLNDSLLKGSKVALDAESARVKRDGDLLLAQAKARGANADEIYKIEQQNRKLLLAAQERYYNDLKNKDSDEAIAAVNNIKNTQNEIKVAEANFQADKLQKSKQAADKNAQQNKTETEKEIADKKKALEDIAKNEKAAALSLLDEREQQKRKIVNDYNDQIKLAAANGKDTIILEEAKLNALKELNDKFKKEDNDKLKEFNKKATEIKTQAIVDELAKSKQVRADKYKEDLDALEQDKVFITKEETEKQALRNALKATFDQDNLKLEADAQTKQHDLKLRALELEQQGLIEGTMSYFDNKKAILDENYAKELDDNKAKYNQGLIDLDEFEKNKAIIEAKYVKQSTDLQKSKFDTYLQYATQVLGALSSVLSQASTVMKMQQDQDIKDAEGNTEKIEEIKKKAFEDNKKMQIAQAIIGTLQSAVQAYQSLAVIPVVGPALGAVAAAAALVFGYKQVALIKAQKYESSSTGASAGGASAGIAPSAPNVAGMQAPQIQTGQGANPTTQLGQTLTNAQKPIRAYVVSQDIQSQTALDRRTNRAATFSGG